jgi:hypothetical protein
MKTCNMLDNTKLVVVGSGAVAFGCNMQGPPYVMFLTRAVSVKQTNHLLGR